MIVDPIYELLEHIKQVEIETVAISQKAQLKLSAFMEEQKIELSDEAAEALQYQDIVSQQLSATIAAIDAVQENLKLFAHSSSTDEKRSGESATRLHAQLALVLAEARAKKEAFSGYSNDNIDEHEIEFF